MLALDRDQQGSVAPQVALDRALYVHVCVRARAHAAPMVSLDAERLTLITVALCRCFCPAERKAALDCLAAENDGLQSRLLLSQRRLEAFEAAAAEVRTAPTLDRPFWHCPQHHAPGGMQPGSQRRPN